MSNKHEISLQTAIEMTTRYRSGRPAGYPKSEAFEMDAIKKLMTTENAAFLRIYYGKSAEGSLHVILVAADADGNDLLPSDPLFNVTQKEDDEEEPVILEDAFRCPHWCPEGSPLDP